MKTILLVDDEPKIRELARDYLEHAGFAVVLAGDGRSALDQARTRRPDLVVLDLGLPEVDGLEVIRTLRRDSSSRSSSSPRAMTSWTSSSGSSSAPTTT